MFMPMPSLLAVPLCGTPQAQYLSSMRTTTMPQTREGETKTPSALRGVTWGQTLMGAQAGLRMEGSKRQVRAGEEVRLTLFLRNTTHQKLAVIYAVKAPLVWDHTGGAVPETYQKTTATGLPGATLIILAPGETLQSALSPLVLNAHFKPGVYRIGGAFLYGMPAHYRLNLGDVRLRKDFPGKAEAQKIMDKNDPIYRGKVTVLTRTGKPYQARTVTVLADSFMTWSLMNALVPPLNALQEANDFIWTPTEEFKVVAAP